MLESAVEAVFAARVRELGGLSYKFAPVHKGNPDRIVILPPVPPATEGEVRLVEIKADGGTLDPAQVLWHRRAAERGVRVDVVTGSTGVRAWYEQEKQRREQDL